MNSTEIKRLASTGKFDELEDAGKLRKAMKWLLQKLEVTQRRKVDSGISDPSTTEFMDFVMNSATLLDEDTIKSMAKEFYKKSQTEEVEVCSVSPLSSDDCDYQTDPNQYITGSEGDSTSAVAKDRVKTLKFDSPILSNESPKSVTPEREKEKEEAPVPQSRKLKRSQSDSTTSSQSKKKPKKFKDPDAPKRPASGYTLFCASRRPSLKIENPDLKPTEVMKTLSLEWKDLSNAEKGPFLESAKQDGERYAKEMEVWRETSGAASRDSKGSKGTKGSKESKEKPSKFNTAREILKRSDTSMAISEESEENDDPSPASSASISPSSLNAKTSSVAGLHAAQKSRIQRAGIAAKCLPQLTGIKQADLGSDDDLLGAKLKLHVDSEFPDDFVPSVGSRVTLVLAPYRSFLSALAPGILTTPQRLQIEAPCASSEQVLSGKVIEIQSDIAADAATLSFVTFKDGNGEKHTILFAPYSSSIVQSDEFLLETSAFESSLEASFLFEGAQVRKLFAASDNSSTAYYIEGSVYEVSSDYKEKPYLSIKVVWLSQEEGTDDWVFAYLQTDCSCSPWELQPSIYISMESNKAKKLPASLRVGNLMPENVYDFFCSQDFCDIFRYRISQQSEEYVAMFPLAEDQLDIHVLEEWLQQGRYNGTRDDIRSKALGVSTLLRDLDRMIANAKRFNECNASFLPWRQADMAQSFLNRLRIQLAKKHPQMELPLLEHHDNFNLLSSSQPGPLFALESEV